MNTNQTSSKFPGLISFGKRTALAMVGLAVVSWCLPADAVGQGRQNRQQGKRVGGAREIQGPNESTQPGQRPPMRQQRGGPQSNGQDSNRSGQRQGRPPRGNSQMPTADQLFAQFDTNGDGQISRTEAQQISDQQFTSVDTDGSQSCDRREIQASLDQLGAQANRQSGNRQSDQGNGQNARGQRGQANAQGRAGSRGPGGPRGQTGGRQRQQQRSGSSSNQCGSMQQQRAPSMAR